MSPNTGNLIAVSRRFRRSLRAIAGLAFLVLVAAGCSDDGFPESYEEQKNDEGVSNVQLNWEEGCQAGFSEDLAQNVNAVCACSYEKISSPVAEGGIAFEDFVEANNRLKSDPESLESRAAEPGSTEAQLVNIVRDCIAAS